MGSTASQARLPRADLTDSQRELENSTVQRLFETAVPLSHMFSEGRLLDRSSLLRFRKNFDCVHERIINDRREVQFDLAQGGCLNILKSLHDWTVTIFSQNVEVPQHYRTVAGDIEDAAARTPFPAILLAKPGIVEKELDAVVLQWHDGNAVVEATDSVVSENSEAGELRGIGRQAWSTAAEVAVREPILA